MAGGPITMTRLVNRIKRKMGLNNMKLPVSEEELVEVILDETLPTFSIYYPNYVSCVLDMAKDKVPGEKDTYYIDTEYFGDDIAIIGVENVVPLDTGMFGYYPLDTYDSTYELFADIQMAENFRAMMTVPSTCFYVPPNKVRIETPVNFYNENRVKIELTSVHPDNLGTINLTYYEQLTDLAVLDMKIFLYEILKRYDKIDTTFGQIDLKIDDWSGAADQRASLIELWGRNYLNNRRRKIYKA